MTPAPQNALVSHCDAATAAALQGAGVAYVLETYAAPFIETGTLVSCYPNPCRHSANGSCAPPKNVRFSAAARAVADLFE